MARDVLLAAVIGAQGLKGEVKVKLKDDALSFEMAAAPPKRPKKKAAPKVKV